MNIIKKIVKVILAIIVMLIIATLLYVGFNYALNGYNWKDDMTALIAFVISAGFSLGLFKVLKD